MCPITATFINTVNYFLGFYPKMTDIVRNKLGKLFKTSKYVKMLYKNLQNVQNNKELA